jgi:hypothetical protein
MLSLLLYPEPAAAIAIYALAFGDGISSVVGKLIGKIRIPFSGGKTLAGSTACFLAVLASTYAVTADARISVIIASREPIKGKLERRGRSLYREGSEKGLGQGESTLYPLLKFLQRKNLKQQNPAG